MVPALVVSVENRHPPEDNRSRGRKPPHAKSAPDRPEGVRLSGLTPGEVNLL